MTSHANATHDLFLVEVARAVGGGERGGAGLAVPRHVPVLRGAADGQRVDAVGVAVTVAAVLLSPAVTRRPDEDGAQTSATLQNTQHVKKTCHRDSAHVSIG